MFLDWMYHVDVFLCLTYYQWSILIEQHDSIAIKELLQAIIEEEVISATVI